VTLDGFNALLGYLPQVCTLWEEPANHSNSVLNRALILGGIRAGKVHIRLQCSANRGVVGKPLVIIEGQGFDERFWHLGQHLLNSCFGVIGLACADLFQPGKERGPVGDDQQGGFMGFAHHEVSLKIPEAGTLIDDLRTLFNTHTSGENPPGVVIIASFAASTAMFKVCVKLFGSRVFLPLAPPDPLIDRLVAYPIDSADGPATADEFRAELFGFQPPGGILF